MKREVFCPSCGASSSYLFIHAVMSSRSERYRGEITDTTHEKPTFKFKCGACNSSWSFTGGKCYMTTKDKFDIEDKGNCEKASYYSIVKFEYDPEGED